MYSYPEDLIEFAAEMGISLVGIGTRSGQALAYLAQPEMRGGADWVNRESAENFFREQGMSCDDAIQPFNKPNGKNRLKLMDADRGLYSLKYPYEIKANDISKRINVDKNVLDNGTKEEQIAEVKKYWFQKVKDKMNECELLMKCLRNIYDPEINEWLKNKTTEIKWIYENILNEPSSKWHIGHLDASKGCESSNLFYQPSIQRAYTNKYVFNRWFERIKVKD